ncbi:Plasma kallikrein [Halotydeus destructor]|nr:Plasma kallikrein [Halotydeus destructor]
MFTFLLLSCLLYQQSAANAIDYIYYYNVELPNQFGDFGFGNLVNRQSPKFTGSSGSSPEVCGVTREIVPNSRIVGGRRALDGEFPHQVSLQSRGSRGGSDHFCGGSVISDRWILTAAHCLSGERVDRMVGFVGANNLRSKDGLTVKFEKAIRHSGYNSRTVQNDIALLKTREPMPLFSKDTSSTLDVNSICLPNPNEQFSGKALISGFGTTSERGSGSSQLLTTEIDLQPEVRCTNLYREFKSTTMVCAGYDKGGKDTCQGDSGGPLFQKQNGRNVLIGVTSFGRGCARANSPGAYTRVASYLDWIQQQTAAN